MRGLLLYMFYCVLRQILAFGRTIRLFGGFAVVLLLAISAEGDVAGEQNAAAGLVGAELSAIDNKPQLSGFSYSDWLQHKYYYGDIYNTDDITISGSGSFWGDVASQFSVDFDNATSRRVQDLLPGADDIRDIVIGDGGKLYFDDWRNDYRAQWRSRSYRRGKTCHSPRAASHLAKTPPPQRLTLASYSTFISKSSPGA